MAAPSGGFSVTPNELRDWADICDESGQIIHQQLGPGVDACTALSSVAAGWSFAGGLPEMQKRWQDLNKLLSDRLAGSAQAFRDSADEYENRDRDNPFLQLWHELFG